MEDAAAALHNESRRSLRLPHSASSHVGACSDDDSPRSGDSAGSSSFRCAICLVRHVLHQLARIGVCVVGRLLSICLEWLHVTAVMLLLSPDRRRQCCGRGLLMNELCTGQVHKFVRHSQNCYRLPTNHIEHVSDNVSLCTCRRPCGCRWGFPVGTLL